MRGVVLCFVLFVVLTKSQTTTPTKTTSTTQTPTRTVSISVSISVTPTPTRTVSISVTPTRTVSISVTPTRTVSVSITPTRTTTNSPSKTQTPTGTPARTVSISFSSTATETPTTTATTSTTPTQTPTSTISATKSTSSTLSPTKSTTSTLSGTSTQTSTQTPSVTQTQSRSDSATQTASQTRTRTPSNTASETTSKSSSPSSTASVSHSGSTTKSTSQSASQSTSETQSATASDSASQSRSETSSATVSATTSRSRTSSASSTTSKTQSSTKSSTQTSSSSESVSKSQSASVSNTASNSVTMSSSSSASGSESISSTVSSSVSVSITQTASSTASSTQSPSQTISATQSKTNTASTSQTPSSTASSSITPSPSPSGRNATCTDAACSFNDLTVSSTLFPSLLNGWATLSGADVTKADFEDSNVFPSYFQRGDFTLFQGSLVVGDSTEIFRFDEGFRPTRDTKFICNTDFDDNRAATTPVLVTVDRFGVARLDPRAFGKISTLNLKGYFPHADIVWTSLVPFLSNLGSFDPDTEPEIAFENTTGWIHLRGTVHLPCQLEECTLFDGLSHLLVGLDKSFESLVVQPLDSNGFGRYLRITGNGTIFLSGSRGNLETEVTLDGIALVPSADTTSKKKSESFTPQQSTVRAERIDSLVQLGGLFIPTNYSFHRAIVTTLDSKFTPAYRQKQLVPCSVAPRILVCAVLVGTGGQVSVLSPFPGRVRYQPDSTGHWVSLDNVRFGGFSLVITIELSGATRITIEGKSGIEIGS